MLHYIVRLTVHDYIVRLTVYDYIVRLTVYDYIVRLTVYDYIVRLTVYDYIVRLLLVISELGEAEDEIFQKRRETEVSPFPFYIALKFYASVCIKVSKQYN